MIRRTFLKALCVSPLGFLIPKTRSGTRNIELYKLVGKKEETGHFPVFVRKDQDFTFSTCGWWSGSFRLEESYDGQHWDEFRTWTGAYDTNVMFSCPRSLFFQETKLIRVVTTGTMHGPKEHDYPARWRLRVGHFNDKGVLV